MISLHAHDDRYYTREQLVYGAIDVVVGAVRQSARPQVATRIRTDYCVIVADTFTVPATATLIVDGVLLVVG
jgi:hypothetical protein